MFELPLQNFHHIGVACNKIFYELRTFLMLGYQQDSEIFTDTIQGIRGVFIRSKTAPTLELLENIEEHGPLDSFLNRGIKFYHLAFVSKNLPQDIDILTKKFKAKLFKPITKATYFAEVCFLMLSSGVIIELVREKI